MIISLLIVLIRSDIIVSNKQYQKEIILLMVRVYLKYSLSYRDLAERIEERGLTVRHTTMMSGVHQYDLVINKMIRKYLKNTYGSARTDVTVIM